MMASTNTDGHGITLHVKRYGARAKVIHLIKRGLQLAPHLANNLDVFAPLTTSEFTFYLRALTFCGLQTALGLSRFLLWSLMSSGSFACLRVASLGKGTVREVYTLASEEGGPWMVLSYSPPPMPLNVGN